MRTARLAANLSREAVAEAAGLHPTFISNVERGSRVPSVPTLIKLAIGLKLTRVNWWMV